MWDKDKKVVQLLLWIVSEESIGDFLWLMQVRMEKTLPKKLQI